jgi:hypothetical protein
MKKIEVCASCDCEVEKLFAVSGVGYCSECQLEAEVAEQEQEEFDSMAGDY